MGTTIFYSQSVTIIVIVPISTPVGGLGGRTAVNHKITGTTVEGRTTITTCSNGCDTLGNIDTGQAAAVCECIGTNTCHAFRNSDIRQTAATIERRIANAGHTVRNRHARQAAAIIERTTTNAGHAFRNADTCQAATATECGITNPGHTVRNRHARQAVTTIECRITNTGYAVRNNNRRKVLVVVESLLGNCGNRLGNYQFFDLWIQFGPETIVRSTTAVIYSQRRTATIIIPVRTPARGFGGRLTTNHKTAGAAIERRTTITTCSNGCDTFRDIDISQTATTIESRITNVGHTVGNRNRRKIFEVVASLLGNPRNRIRNHQFLNAGV